MFRSVLLFGPNSYPYATLIGVMLWLPHIHKEISLEASARKVVIRMTYSDRP